MHGGGVYPAQRGWCQARQADNRATGPVAVRNRFAQNDAAALSWEPTRPRRRRSLDRWTWSHGCQLCRKPLCTRQASEPGSSGRGGTSPLSWGREAGNVGGDFARWRERDGLLSTPMVRRRFELDRFGCGCRRRRIAEVSRPMCGRVHQDSYMYARHVRGSRKSEAARASWSPKRPLAMVPLRKQSRAASRSPSQVRMPLPDCADRDRHSRPPTYRHALSRGSGGGRRTKLRKLSRAGMKEGSESRAAVGWSARGFVTPPDRLLRVVVRTRGIPARCSGQSVARRPLAMRRRPVLTHPRRVCGGRVSAGGGARGRIGHGERLITHCQ